MTTLKIIIAILVGWNLILTFLVVRAKTAENASGNISGPISASEFRLVDKKGTVLAKLGSSGEGLSSLQFFDSSAKDPRIDISLDDKGAHLFLAGEQKQQSYLFLKKGGPTGIVLVDKEGVRRAEMMLDSSGKPSVQQF